jgi:hypothetical protein
MRMPLTPKDLSFLAASAPRAGSGGGLVTRKGYRSRIRNSRNGVAPCPDKCRLPGERRPVKGVARRLPECSGMFPERDGLTAIAIRTLAAMPADGGRVMFIERSGGVDLCLLGCDPRAVGRG